MDKVGVEAAESVNKLHAECLLRQRAEERSTELEAHLSAVLIHEGVLKLKNQQLSRQVKRLTKRIGYFDKEMKTALSTLCRLGPDKMSTHELDV